MALPPAIYQQMVEALAIQRLMSESSSSHRSSIPRHLQLFDDHTLISPSPLQQYKDCVTEKFFLHQYSRSTSSEGCDRDDEIDSWPSGNRTISAMPRSQGLMRAFVGDEMPLQSNHPVVPVEHSHHGEFSHKTPHCLADDYCTIFNALGNLVNPKSDEETAGKTTNLFVDVLFIDMANQPNFFHELEAILKEIDAPESQSSLNAGGGDPTTLPFQSYHLFHHQRVLLQLPVIFIAFCEGGVKNYSFESCSLVEELTNQKRLLFHHVHGGKEAADHVMCDIASRILYRSHSGRDVLDSDRPYNQSTTDTSSINPYSYRVRLFTGDKRLGLGLSNLFRRSFLPSTGESSNCNNTIEKPFYFYNCGRRERRSFSQPRKEIAGETKQLMTNDILPKEQQPCGLSGAISHALSDLGIQLVKPSSREDQLNEVVAQLLKNQTK